MDSAGKPAVVVYRAVAEYLKVLGLVSAGGFGVIKAVKHAHALDWILYGPVDARWLRQLGSFEHCRTNIDNVMPLGTHFALSLNALRPVNDHSVARAAII